MSQIVECVPNFSEGRRPEVVQQIVDAIRQAGRVDVLDVQMDPDHNRSVVTFVGSPEEVAKAAFAGVAKAAELIDMEQHRGEHPRMGATDVVPFVPIRGVTMADCVQLAHEVGRRIGEELGIPVYLYEAAATRPDRQNLADVRRGEYEGLKETIATDPDRAPDYGPARIGPAGATAVGARPPLIAYNINLGTDNIEIAQQIARAVRHSSGGLRYVKALGFEIHERGIVQVSMNMTDYKKSPLFRVFYMVQREAARYGVPVIGSEIVGLTPAGALLDTAEFYLQLEEFDPDIQVLENRLADTTSVVPDAFLDALAAGTPTPGGGSAAAVAGAMAASLVHMAAELSIGRPRYAAVEAAMQQVKQQAAALKAQLSRLAEEDIAAYDAVMQAYRLPKDTEEQRTARTQAIQAALQRATEVPIATARACRDVLSQAQIVARDGNVNAASDVGVGGHLAMAGVQGAVLNVRVNTKSLSDQSMVSAYQEEVQNVVAEAQHLFEQVLATVKERGLT